MTRKTRRSTPEDPTPQEPEDSQPRPTKAPRKPKPKRRKSSPAAGRQAAEAEQPAAEEPAKVSLPAFGFAEDLLKKPAPAKDREPAEDRKPAEAPAAEAAARDVAPVSESDPRRIFRFADSLEQTRREEAEAIPVRLETWVAFSLAGEIFALPVEPVREVVRVASITRVPHAPRPIRGVTNMRGRVIPVIDLRLRIELPETELGRASRVIVVSSRGLLLGLLVDAVHQVVHIDRALMQPPPEDVMTIQSDYLSGVYHLDDQLILLLDIDRALIIHGAEAMSEHAAAGVAQARDDAPRDASAGDAPAGTA